MLTAAIDWGWLPAVVIWIVVCLAIIRDIRHHNRYENRVGPHAQPYCPECDRVWWACRCRRNHR